MSGMRVTKQAINAVMFEMHPDFPVTSSFIADMPLNDGKVTLYETGHALDALRVDSWSTVDIEDGTVVCYPQDATEKDAKTVFMQYANALVAITTSREQLMLVTVREQEVREKDFVTTAG